MLMDFHIKNNVIILMNKKLKIKNETIFNPYMYDFFSKNLHIILRKVYFTGKKRRKIKDILHV